MTVYTFLVCCPRCGTQEINPDAISLQVCTNNVDRSFYAWDCPSCTSEIRELAPPAKVVKLLAGGVEPRTWGIPAESLEEHDGPALTTDDLLDFMRELRSLIALDTTEGAT